MTALTIYKDVRLSTISDEVLMLEFQRGTRSAFDELYARYRGPLFGYFSRRLFHRERADDLVQETFLAVIKGIARYEPRSQVRTYLYAVAQNLLAADRRKSSGTEQQMDEEHEVTVETSADSPIWVKQALEKLDETDREVLMLREYEQLSYSEISDLLRIPLNTVRSRLFRARMALKEILLRRIGSKTSAAGAARTPMMKEELQ